MSDSLRVEFDEGMKISGGEVIGADFFGDETWYDTPPPQKVEGVAMKIAGLQQQTREEQ